VNTLKTFFYRDPESPDFIFSVVQAPGGEPAFFPARLRPGTPKRKRIARSTVPVRTTLEESAADLRTIAIERGWKISGVMEIDRMSGIVPVVSKITSRVILSGGNR